MPNSHTSDADLRGDHIITGLKASLRRRGTTLVGAAIGTGMAALAASRGGADFLLALNAGRIRSMGAPSILSLLALRESNNFVMDFATSEILPNTRAPVFFGASAFDPRQGLEAIVSRVVDAGFEAVVNFPTAVFLGGAFRQAVEAAGIGFRREVELLRTARRRGLATLAYVHDAAEAQAMADAGVHIINVNLGWNVGGAVGVRSTLSLVQAAEYARAVFSKVRRINPDAICLLEGGPVVTPEEMYQVCRASKADGYIGGSTIDRVPSEHSIEDVTSAFKAVGTLQRKIDELEKKIERIQRHYSIVGRSDGLVRAKRAVERIARSAVPVLITGERGTGKALFAHAIHEIGRRARARARFVIPAGIEPAGSHLFGRGAGENTKRQVGYLEAYAGDTILIEHVDELAPDVQERVLELIETGHFRTLDEERLVPFSGRLIFSSLKSAAELQASGAAASSLIDLLILGHLALPPLRERLEDIPLLAEHFLRRLAGDGGTPLTVDHSAYRALLSWTWPGNVRELRAVLETAAMQCDGSTISAQHLPRLGGSQVKSVPAGNEREWILEALRRHRFRKGEAARFLGVSRKTLYNKMRLHGLPIRERTD